MPKIELPYWLQSLTITGREDDEDKDNSEENSDEDQDNDEDDKNNEDDKNSEGTPEEKLAALELALEKERKLRRQAERDARKAKKSTKPPEQKQAEDDETKQELAKSQTKISLLAQGFLDSKVEAAVLAEARKQGFIDPTDALINSVLKEVDADQDEEDPTDVEVDLESVVDAVKALAKKKQHLVGKGTATTKSGSKFRGKGNEDKGSDAALVEYYPSLR